MKRTAVWVVLVTVVLSCASASAAPPLRSELVGVSPGWSRSSVTRADTASCPASTFADLSGRSSAGEVLVDSKSETILLEKIVASSQPAHTYDELLARITHCNVAASSFDGQVTFPRVRPVSLGHTSVPVKAFSVSFVVQGAAVTGVVAYAKKGTVSVALAEVTLTQLNASGFRATLRRAIARIT